MECMVGSPRLIVSFWGLVLAIVIAAPVAEATSVTYYLDQSNVESIYPDGTNYARVDISDAGSDILFTVSVVPGVFSPGTNFGLQTFGFNLAPGAPSLLAANFLLPSGWSVSAGSNQDGFGNFDWVLGGTGSNRQSPLSFTIQGVTGDILASYFDLSSNNSGQGNQYFAAHIAGFIDPTGAQGEGAVTSGFFAGGTPVVPLPATAWLLLSGVVGLGALARRRRLAAA
jgi:hypothetical protein